MSNASNKQLKRDIFFAASFCALIAQNKSTTKMPLSWALCVRNSMGPITKELVDVLDQLIIILDEDEIENWASYMSRARQLIVASDYSGVERVLNAYGGMGSFNDISLKKITKKNCNFSKLHTRAWELSKEISRAQ